MATQHPPPGGPALVANVTRPPVVGGGGVGGGGDFSAPDGRCPPGGVGDDVPLWLYDVICTMYLVFGVVYSLFGYRCFKAVMFLTGFTFGSVVVYAMCRQDTLMPSYGNAGVAVGAGILFGLITMLVQHVSLFTTGFHTGLFVGIAVLAIGDHFAWKPELWAIACVLLGGGLLFAILNLFCQKGLTILGTSIYGGAILASALDYFVENFLMVKWVWTRVAHKRTTSDLCWTQQPQWYSWLILSVWPLMVFIGMITQCAITGRGIYHHELVPSKKSHGMNVQRARTREQRAELRQKKYRYLYQVRTAHGDVISQSYVQALQRKVCGPGETNTLQSDSTHLTILPADQTVLAALTESEDDSREVSGDIIQLDRRHESSRESFNFNLVQPPFR